jgi:hypothetical protein
VKFEGPIGVKTESKDRKGVNGGGESIRDKTGRSGGKGVAEFGEPIRDEDNKKEDFAEFGEPIPVERKEEKIGEERQKRERTPPRRTGGTNRWRERAPAVLGRS